MQLEQLGWNLRFSSYFRAFEQSGFIPGRVTVQQRAFYQVYTEQGEILADISGAFRHQSQYLSDFPAVGDWVALQPHDDSNAIIHAVLPRTSQFSRKVAGNTTDEHVLAANVDTAFLVSGLDHDFNLRRIERFLVMAWESGAKPVVILNKADLCHDIDLRVAEVEAIAPGMPVVSLSALHQSGIAPIMPYLRTGETIVLLGSSGVGKSTLTNQLLGISKQAVESVRPDDSRGRHTTTHRELMLTPSGALLIDTPGLREIQLWSGRNAIDEVFTDIEELAERCRFRDCHHRQEPGCAVQEAIADGRLDSARLASYQKLNKELDYVTRKQDERLQSNTKARWKQIHKEMRRHPKRR
ncbi:MAG TPA: ribosome small subunit-dependent GTPase A [Elainellaceae cyanobacterium]